MAQQPFDPQHAAKIGSALLGINPKRANYSDEEWKGRIEVQPIEYKEEIGWGINFTIIQQNEKTGVKEDTSYYLYVSEYDNYLKRNPFVIFFAKLVKGKDDIEVYQLERTYNVLSVTNALVQWGYWSEVDVIDL